MFCDKRARLSEHHCHGLPVLMQISFCDSIHFVLVAGELNLMRERETTSHVIRRSRDHLPDEHDDRRFSGICVRSQNSSFKLPLVPRAAVIRLPSIYRILSVLPGLILGLIKGRPGYFPTS